MTQLFEHSDIHSSFVIRISSLNMCGYNFNMPKRPADDPYKRKFRPDADAALDAQIDAELGDISMDQLYGFDKPHAADAPAGKGLRRGRVVSIDKDSVFVDLGGKSQGIVPFVQFETEPKVGQEMEFHVQRYNRARVC